MGGGDDVASSYQTATALPLHFGSGSQVVSQVGEPRVFAERRVFAVDNSVFNIRCAAFIQWSQSLALRVGRKPETVA